MKKRIFITSFFLMLFLLYGCTNTETGKPIKKVSEKEKQETYMLIRGISLAEEGKIDEALIAFKSAYSLNSKNLKTVKYIALCYSKLGDNANGKKYFEEALKIEPFDQEVIYNYSILYYGEKEYGKALELLNRIKIENIDRKVILAKAMINFNLNDYNKSFDEFSKIMEDGTDYGIEIDKNYILVMKKVGKNDLVYKYIYSLYYKDKGNFQKLQIITEYLIEVKAFDDAENLLKEYGRENGYKKEILLALAELMLLKEDYEHTKMYLNLLEEKYSMELDILKFKVKYFRNLGLEKEAKELEKIINNTNGIEK